jgi:hypothetical protein
VEQEIDKVLSSLEKLNIQRSQGKSELDRLKTELADMGEKQKYSQQQIDSKVY